MFLLFWEFILEKMLKSIKNFFVSILNFVKQYPGIIYSLLLILVLPLMLYYNAFLSLRMFQNNIDYTLQTKALISENILSNLFSDFFDQPEIIQKKIEKISNENSEIKNLFVAKEARGGEFEIIASQNPNQVGQFKSEPSFALAYSQNQAIANLITKEGERFWTVVKPIYHKDSGIKIGLVGMSLSLRDADILLGRVVFRSYLIVFLTVLFSLFLIFQHTRLFSYVSLSKKLKEIDEMKDDFIKMTTHELRNPIVALRGYLDILESDLKKVITEKQKVQFERLKISAKNLNDLIEDILDVTRIEQGRLDFTPQMIPVNNKIKEITEELKLKAEEKNLELNIELVQGEYYLNLNPERFRQVLFNLIDNAIKYTEKGKISVISKIEELRKRYIIEIKDTGVGISAEDQKRLFEQFYRVKTKKTAGIQGTGLGLWITKQICEKMGGQIFIESMEGVGTKFTLIFPLAEKKENKKLD